MAFQPNIDDDDDEDYGSNTDVNDINNNDDGSGQDDDQQQQQQAAAPQVDHEAIARTVAATMQQFAPQQQQERQYTPEELAKHFQVWNPDEGFVNQLNQLTDADVPLAERQKLLHAMRDGMVGQAFRAAELLVEQRLNQFEQRVAPAVQYAQERESKNLLKEFEGKYPALKGQQELVNSITARLGAQGFRPKSKDEAFEKVAEVAETILKGVNPNFKLKPSGGANGMPSMAGTNMGGQTGGFQTGSGGNANPKKRGGLASIFQNR